MSDTIPFRSTSVIVEAVRDREKFRSGPLWGSEISQDEKPTTGEMPDEFAIIFRIERPTYMVVSYQTPIAWWSKMHGWMVPEVKYTRTTTRHQNAVRAALRGERVAG